MAGVNWGNFSQPLTGSKSVTTPQKKKGGITGFLSSAVKSVTSPASYFLKNDIVNPAQSLLADATGDKLTSEYLMRQSNKDIGLGDKGRDLTGALKKVAGNSVGLATTVLAPEAKVGVLARSLQGAKIGAAAGAGGALANNGNLEDTLTGGIEGGLLGGGIGGASGILSKATSKVSNVADKRATTKTEKIKTEQKIENEKAFANIPKKMRESGDLQGTMQHLNDLGVEPNVKNLKTFSNLVTGENGIVSGTTRQLLGKVGAIHTSGVLDDVKNALMNEAGQLGNVEDRGAAAGVLRSVRNTIQGIGYKGKGSLTDTADANDAFDVVQNLEKRVRELGGTKASGTNGAEARVLQTASHSLKQKISDEADPTVKAHTLEDDDVEAIRKAVKKAGGNDEIADHIINGVNNATSLNDLRRLQKPFVNAANLGDAAEVTGGGALTRAEKEGPSALDEATNVGTNLLLGNHFGIAQNSGRLAQKTGVLDRLVGGAGRVADTASQVGAAVPGGLLNRVIATGARTAGMGVPENGQQPAQPVSAPADQLQPNVNSQDQPEEPTIDKKTLLALIASDPDNATTYISLYNLFNKDTTKNATQQKAVTASKNAEATLDQIKESFNAAGGGQGKLGGTLANIGGKLGLNSNAATYNDTATALAASLYKALGNTGTISDRDQQLIANLIPKTTDTDVTARAKISQLEDLLQQAETNTEAT